MADRLRETLPPGSSRALHLTVYGFSAAVVGLVILLVGSPPRTPPAGLRVEVLPGFHAALNGTVALLLCAAFIAIRSGRVRLHRLCMLTCFILSAVFLVSYVTYHTYAPSGEFGGEGWVRPVYFTILLTHIPLAAAILPLALLTLLRALRGDFPAHRRLARWTLPIWLYVAVTGVTVYAMMRPYYTF